MRRSRRTPADSSARSRFRFELINLFDKGTARSGEGKDDRHEQRTAATPMGEVPRQGKRIDLRGALVGRINAENLIVEERRYYDTGTMMKQLGLAPEVRSRWESARDSRLDLKRTESPVVLRPGFFLSSVSRALSCQPRLSGE